MQRRCRINAGVLLAVVMTAGPWSVATARAAEQVTFPGSATIAANKHPAEFTFTCSSSGPNTLGSFGVAIRVPVGARAAFDFDPFDGPDGTRRRLSNLVVRDHGAVRREAFAASGGYGPGKAFTLTVAAARNDPAAMKALAMVLKPLVRGATLVWRQRGAHAHDAGFVAELPVSAGGAERLSATIAPCLAR